MGLRDIDFKGDREKLYNIRRILLLRNFSLFVMFSIFIFYFLLKIDNYNSSTKYVDNFNTIKQHELGYNIYNREGKLEKIVFYNYDENDEIIGFIDNNIFFENTTEKDLLKYFSIGETLLYHNLDSKLYLTEDSIKINTLKNYKILELGRNKDNFIILYKIEDLEKNKQSYCFNVNNINFNKDMGSKKQFCLINKTKNYQFGFVEYSSDIFLIYLGKNIFIYSIKDNNVIGTFYSDLFIEKLSKKINGDIDLFYKGKEGLEIKTLRVNLIKYYIDRVRKTKLKKISTKKLELGEIF